MQMLATALCSPVEKRRFKWAFGKTWWNCFWLYVERAALTSIIAPLVRFLGFRDPSARMNARDRELLLRKVSSAHASATGGSPNCSALPVPATKSRNLEM